MSYIRAHPFICLFFVAEILATVLFLNYIRNELLASRPERRNYEIQESSGGDRVPHQHHPSTRNWWGTKENPVHWPE